MYSLKGESMDGFYNKDGKAIVDNLIVVIKDNKGYLSDIDGLIGDGDHGINMSKGCSICQERLKDTDASFYEALKALSSVLLTEIGGSMGPLYGTFFNKMARRCKAEEIIDKDVFGDMLKSAVDGIIDLGGAKVGDKTLVDVLVPALEAYEKAVEDGKNFENCLTDMSAAA